MHEMEMMGPMVFGYPLEVLLMLLSGVFYLICAGFIWKAFRQEKNELIGALFAFLVYQAISMFFMGLDMHTMNMLYADIASLSILIGSVYMLKFPFSQFSQGTRRVMFLLSFIIVVGIYAWFMTSPERHMALMNFTIWYDIVVNGLVVGITMLYAGFTTKLPWVRVKAIGGGTGIASCCVVSNVAMLAGAVAISSTFQFLAPVAIVGAIALGRRQQKMTGR